MNNRVYFVRNTCYFFYIISTKFYLSSIPSTLPLLLSVYTGIWKDIPCKSEYILVILTSNKFQYIHFPPEIFIWSFSLIPTQFYSTIPYKNAHL